MSSFDHKIWPIDPVDVAFRRRYVKNGGPLRWIECAANRCVQEVTHSTSYQYAHGERGRIIRAIRHVCPEHAAKFAKKHGLIVPEARTMEDNR